nr:MAG TPA: hypothetical protein [Caudoviricetes sp.]
MYSCYATVYAFDKLYCTTITAVLQCCYFYTKK